MKRTDIIEMLEDLAKMYESDLLDEHLMKTKCTFKNVATASIGNFRTAIALLKIEPGIKRSRTYTKKIKR